LLSTQERSNGRNDEGDPEPSLGGEQVRARWHSKTKNFGLQNIDPRKTEQRMQMNNKPLTAPRKLNSDLATPNQKREK
jgi:hypothetical protein